MPSEPHWFLILVYLGAGFLLLTKGADWLVGSSSQVARRMGISTLVVGLTIVRRRLPGSEISVLAEVMQFGLVLFLLSSIFGAVETNNVVWVLMGLSTATFVVARKYDGWVPESEVRP